MKDQSEKVRPVNIRISEQDPSEKGPSSARSVDHTTMLGELVKNSSDGGDWQVEGLGQVRLVHSVVV